MLVTSNIKIYYIFYIFVSDKIELYRRYSLHYIYNDVNKIITQKVLVMYPKLLNETIED